MSNCCSIHDGIAYPLVIYITVCDIENGPVEIVDLSIKDGDFPYKLPFSHGDFP